MRRTVATNTSTEFSLTTTNVDWMLKAICRGMDITVFYPEGRGKDLKRSERRARRICDTCPVQQQCRAYADANDERYGIWGATSAKERGWNSAR